MSGLFCNFSSSASWQIILLHFNSAAQSQCTASKLQSSLCPFLFQFPAVNCNVCSCSSPISLLFKISPGFGCWRERRHDKGIEHHALPELLGLNHPVTATLSCCCWKDLPGPGSRGHGGCVGHCQMLWGASVLPEQLEIQRRGFFLCVCSGCALSKGFSICENQGTG